MSDAILIRDLHKSFGEKIAVQALDLCVPRGSLHGFIGPNGAGKTTSIRMVMSIIFPDRGELSVLGRPSAVESKDKIGYLPEERGVYKKMKVLAFLKYMARLKGVPASQLHTRASQWLERVELGEVAGKKCEELSKGMQQKIQFVAAVIHEPELLILDEPFSGLDPVNMRLLRDLIRELNTGGTTIIFSTHVMAQAEQLCDNIVMINHGRKVLDDPLETIRNRFDPNVIVFEPADESTSADQITSLGCVHVAEQVTDAWELTLAEGCQPSRAIAEISSCIPATRIEVKKPSLEDIFIQIVESDDVESEETVTEPAGASV